MNDRLNKIKEAVITRQRNEIQGLVKTAIDEGVDANTIIEDGLIQAMDVVGKQFAESDIFVPEMLVSALTMKLGLETVKPFLKGDESTSKGSVIMATVKGDLHDIGKNIVIMMLEGAGFQVVDLGVDLSVEKLITEIQSVKPDILGLSALLTTTLPEMERVMEALQTKGLRDKVKVMVGGAPVGKAFSDRIGADGYGADATEAVALARELVESTKAP
ncbi:MAG: corrinoid protein [Desulfobacteraceae bacterium]|nr:corrinoid protein [Desulfobacteraceae bacterium]